MRNIVIRQKRGRGTPDVMVDLIRSITLVEPNFEPRGVIIMGRILMVLVALIAMGTAANAAVLASGALFGGFNQANAACLLFNAGTDTITVSGSEIVQQGSGPVTLASNNCSTLAAGAICDITAVIANNAAYACKFVLSPRTADVQGTFEIVTGDGKGVLATAPLQ